MAKKKKDTVEQSLERIKARMDRVAERLPKPVEFQELKWPTPDYEIVPLAEQIENAVKGPPKDRTLADIQEAYDEVKKETGKRPSKAKVVKRSGYSRGTVRERWHQIRD